MRADIETYRAVEAAAEKFVRSVAEGNSAPARELFIDEAVLFGYLDNRLEHGSIEQFYHNVDTVAAVPTSRRVSTCWMSRRRWP